MTPRYDRRSFIGVMIKIMGAGTGLSLNLNPMRAFAQNQDEIGVAWLKLACTGQSFVGEGMGHSAMSNLMVRHELFTAGAETIEALGAGALDASYLGITPAIAATSRGLKAKIYAGGHRRGMGLVVLGDSPVHSVKDLVGKTVSTLGRGSVPDIQLRVTAMEMGLNPDTDFNLVSLPSSDAITALKMGGVDALMNCPEWPQVALTSIPGSRFAAADKDDTLWHGPDTQCVVVIVLDDFVGKSPGVVEKLLEVHVRASRTMKDEPEKAAEIIASYEGAPAEATLLALTHMDVTPVPSVSSIKKWRDKMAEFGFIEDKVAIKDLVDLAPLRTVLTNLKEDEWLADLEKQSAQLEELD